MGNKVQETEQELSAQDQKRAKEMTIPEMKTTMTNFDYVGKRVIGQRTAITAFLVEVLPTLKEIAPWNKRTEQTNIIRVFSNNKRKSFNVDCY